MSDCSAVANFMKNGYATNSTDASAKALNGGLDVYGGWGDHLWEQGYLHQAITDGQTTEAVLNQAMMRTTIQKMKVGAFDPLEVSELLGESTYVCHGGLACGYACVYAGMRVCVLARTRELAFDLKCIQ